MASTDILGRTQVQAIPSLTSSQEDEADLQIMCCADFTQTRGERQWLLAIRREKLNNREIEFNGKNNIEEKKSREIAADQFPPAWGECPRTAMKPRLSKQPLPGHRGQIELLYSSWEHISNRELRAFLMLNISHFFLMQFRRQLFPFRTANAFPCEGRAPILVCSSASPRQIAYRWLCG